MAEFNAKQQLPGLLDWMRAQMKACGGKTAVIGISGGKDSSVTAALSVAAYGRENVVGVLMPDGVQPDIDYSNGLVDVLNIRHYTFNIHGGTSGILDEMARVGIDASRQTKVNLPSRIRMATLYAIAQSEEGGIVINTSNLSEDWVGYCTIYGDSAGAFSPLGMYTTEEVIALGAELGLPERFLIKPPSDGLTGKTDEDNLGFTYHAVNEYIRKGEVDPTIKEQIDRKHKVSRFKFQTLPVYQNGLPIVLPEETDYYNPNKKEAARSAARAKEAILSRERMAPLKPQENARGLAPRPRYIARLRLEELRGLRDRVRCTWLRHGSLRIVTSINRALLS